MKWSNKKRKNLNKKKTAGEILILHMFTKNHNHLMYGSWEMEWDQQFFIIVGHVLPFHPRSNSENQNFEKMKKGICTKNQDHNMMYASWDVECGRHNFLLFWAIFCPFTLLTIQKIKILKKNAWRYYPFIHTYHKWRSCDV